jgi:predicted Fe-Mo cluster-binding NifX family protein
VFKVKIAVSSSGTNLNCSIDPRFGRCAYFIIVNTDDMSFGGFDNESIGLGGGAGIQSAQFVASKGAEVVITGNVGPNAVRTLSAAGVQLVVGQMGTVREAIDDYKRGRLKATSEARLSQDYGVGGGAGLGRGMGRGRGRGRGMGGGTGGARRPSPGPPESSSLSEEEELKWLKDQAGALRKQIEAIDSGIKNLEDE